MVIESPGRCARHSAMRSSKLPTNCPPARTITSPTSSLAAAGRALRQDGGDRGAAAGPSAASSAATPSQPWVDLAARLELVARRRRRSVDRHREARAVVTPGGLGEDPDELAVRVEQRRRRRSRVWCRARRRAARRPPSRSTWSRARCSREMTSIASIRRVSPSSTRPRRRAGRPRRRCRRAAANERSASTPRRRAAPGRSSGSLPMTLRGELVADVGCRP